MRKWICLVALGCLLAAMTACSAGRDFARPDAGTLELGKTTEQQIRDRFGEPRSGRSVTINDKHVKLLTYNYAEAYPYVQKVPTRTMSYAFHEDRLVEHLFISSFDGDKTNFDDSMMGQVVRGKTTRAQVLELLGRPAGMAIHPVVKETDQLAYTYNYVRVDRPPFQRVTITRKQAMIIFDAQGLVVETRLDIAAPK